MEAKQSAESTTVNEEESRPPESTHLFKFILLGAAHAGKTSLVHRFVDNTFPSTYTPTIGVDFKTITGKINGEVVKLQLWDSAGQERFRNIATSYLRGTQGIILVFDLTDKESFQTLVNDHMYQIHQHANKDVQLLVVGNKSDQPIQINLDAVTEFANGIGASFIQTSSKTGENVDEAFFVLSRKLHEKVTGKCQPERSWWNKAASTPQEKDIWLK